jgi:CRP-like cAMP-binding protein
LIESHDSASIPVKRQVIASPRNIKSKRKSTQKRAFDAQAFLDSAGTARKVVEYRRSQKIYSQGDPAASVMYIQKGGVKLSVVNEVGKEAVLAILRPGDFFGEGGHGRSVCSNGNSDRDYPHDFTRY